MQLADEGIHRISAKVSRCFDEMDATWGKGINSFFSVKLEHLKDFTDHHGIDHGLEIHGKVAIWLQWSYGGLPL